MRLGVINYGFVNKGYENILKTSSGKNIKGSMDLLKQ